MFNSKFIISSLVFMSFLIITSVIKNKTRIIEKKISTISKKISSKEKNLNEAQLDFHYLTSPAEVEKRLNIIGGKNYQPISHSKIFLNIADFTGVNSKTSNINNINEKKIKKK